MIVAGMDTSTETVNLAVEKDGAEPETFNRMELDSALAHCYEADIVIIELPGEGYIPPRRHGAVIAARDTAVRLHDRLARQNVDARLMTRDCILELVLGEKPRKDADKKLYHHLLTFCDASWFASKGCLKNADLRDAYAALLAGRELLKAAEVPNYD